MFIIILSNVACALEKGDVFMRFGAYYYDTWYKKTPQWTDRLLGEFSGREPLWGWLSDSVESMEKQIDYAVSGGLDFWAFDWYYPEMKDEDFIPAKQALAELEKTGFIKSKNSDSSYYREPNYALERFFNSKNCDKLNFCLLVANHDGHHGSWLLRNDRWEDACEYFIHYMSKPNAVKVDGKPLIIIFNADLMVDSMGGEENVRKGLEYLHDLCVKRGLGGCVVAASFYAFRNDRDDVDNTPSLWRDYTVKLKNLGFDAVTGYNYSRHFRLDENGNKYYEYPFDALSEDYEKIWEIMKENSVLPYMPAVNGGWDCRPWQTVWETFESVGQYMPDTCYSDDMSGEKLEKHVRNLGKFIEENKDKCLSDLSVCYAWNELGEGGYIAPTKEKGDEYLKAIKRVADGN